MRVRPARTSTPAFSARMSNDSFWRWKFSTPMKNRLRNGREMAQSSGSFPARAAVSLVPALTAMRSSCSSVSGSFFPTSEAGRACHPFASKTYASSSPPDVSRSCRKSCGASTLSTPAWVSLVIAVGVTFLPLFRTTSPFPASTSGNAGFAPSSSGSGTSRHCSIRTGQRVVKVSKISSSDMPIARSRIVAGILRRLSTLRYSRSL